MENRRKRAVYSHQNNQMFASELLGGKISSTAWSHNLPSGQILCLLNPFKDMIQLELEHHNRKLMTL